MHCYLPVSRPRTPGASSAGGFCVYIFSVSTILNSTGCHKLTWLGVVPQLPLGRGPQIIHLILKLASSAFMESLGVLDLYDVIVLTIC